MMSIDGSNCALSPLGWQRFASADFDADPRKFKLVIATECDGYHTHDLNCSGRDWKSSYHDLVALFCKVSQELHAVLCDGAFSLDRDPMDLVPLFRRLQDEEVSCGYARDSVRRWLAGLPSNIADEAYPSENLTFDEAEVIHHLNRIRLGLEYDGEGRATILDTDAALLHGIFHKLREKAADAEAETQRIREKSTALVEEVRSMLKTLGLKSEKP